MHFICAVRESWPLAELWKLDLGTGCAKLLFLRQIPTALRAYAIKRRKGSECMHCSLTCLIEIPHGKILIFFSPDNAESVYAFVDLEISDHITCDFHLISKFTTIVV